MADVSPMSLEQRIDRMESTEQIRQLVARYALALDTRNFDDMVELFIPNVQVGRDAFGRDKLRAWFVKTMSNTKSSIHFVGNHIIDLDPTTPTRRAASSTAATSWTAATSGSWARSNTGTATSGRRAGGTSAAASSCAGTPWTRSTAPATPRT